MIPESAEAKNPRRFLIIALSLLAADMSFTRERTADTSFGTEPRTLNSSSPRSKLIGRNRGRSTACSRPTGATWRLLTRLRNAAAPVSLIVWNLLERGCRYKPLEVQRAVVRFLGLGQWRPGRSVPQEEDELVRFECTEGEVRSVWEDRLLRKTWTAGCAMTRDGRRAVTIERNEVILWDLERRTSHAMFSLDS